MVDPINTIKNVGESVTQKSSSAGEAVDAAKQAGSKEGNLIEQAEGTLADAISPAVDRGTGAVADSIVAFLKTKEGRKVAGPIAAYLLKKYWWAVAGIAAFEIIGIVAMIRMTLSVSRR
jgi:hypothetical protein